VTNIEKESCHRPIVYIRGKIPANFYYWLFTFPTRKQITFSESQSTLLAPINIAGCRSSSRSTIFLRRHFLASTRGKQPSFSLVETFSERDNHTFKGMAHVNSNDSLRWKVNSNLRQAILEGSEDDPVTRLLYSVVYGYTSTTLATEEMLSSNTNTKDLNTYLSRLSIQALFLASEYPFLQPQLVDLINTILSNPSFPEESKDQFSSGMITDISDTTKSNYGHLFDEKQRTKDLIDDHINLHRFLARLLPLGGLVEIDDAMYMLCVGLEDYSHSHKAPDIDVPAAAQYVIHAAAPIFDACVKGYVALFLRFLQSHPLNNEAPISANTSSQTWARLHLARQKLDWRRRPKLRTMGLLEAQFRGRGID
jgi:hypothetical protein